MFLLLSVKIVIHVVIVVVDAGVAVVFVAAVAAVVVDADVGVVVGTIALLWKISVFFCKGSF